MKYLFAILMLTGDLAWSQINLPELSPEATLADNVGYTNIRVRYGRPAARGRKIIGDLVPFKKLWRTGAGRCTMITFDNPVEINNQTIPAGAYAFLTIPDENEWKIMLNSDTTKIYGDPKEYDPTSQAIAFTVVPEKTERHFESLTISLDIVKYDAVLYLAWEKTQVSFSIKTHSYERALSEIDKSIQENPNDPDRLSQAAWFYYMNHDDPEQMLAWIDKGLQSGDDRWLLQQRFNILERMKKYDEASRAAERAITFLKTRKPDAWEEEARNYKERMASWPRQTQEKMK